MARAINDKIIGATSNKKPSVKVTYKPLSNTTAVKRTATPRKATRK